MKRILILFLLSIITIGAYSKTEVYQTTAFASNVKNSYGYWNGWSSFTSSNLIITFYSDINLITINSATPQRYRIVYYEGIKYGPEGDERTYFKVLDQDGDYGHVWTRVSNGTRQFYVEFANIMWMYNVYQVY